MPSNTSKKRELLIQIQEIERQIDQLRHCAADSCLEDRALIYEKIDRLNQRVGALRYQQKMIEFSGEAFVGDLRASLARVWRIIRGRSNKDSGRLGHTH